MRRPPIEAVILGRLGDVLVAEFWLSLLPAPRLPPFGLTQGVLFSFTRLALLLLPLCLFSRLSLFRIFPALVRFLRHSDLLPAAK